MFSNCKTLAELNAARISLSAEPNADIVSINNAYNKRRTEIMETRKPFVKLTPTVCSPRPVQRLSGIPITGRSSKPATIEITGSGILY